MRDWLSFAVGGMKDEHDGPRRRWRKSYCDCRSTCQFLGLNHLSVLVKNLNDEGENLYTRSGFDVHTQCVDGRLSRPDQDLSIAAGPPEVNIVPKFGAMPPRPQAESFITEGNIATFAVPDRLQRDFVQQPPGIARAVP